MNALIILPYYLRWHYGTAIGDIGRLLRRFLIFVYHFFSISTLLATLVSPWQRINESYARGSSLEGYMESFIVNSLMRGVGIVVRSIVILIGLAVFLVTLAGGILALALWLALPVVLVYVFGYGVVQLKQYGF